MKKLFFYFLVLKLTIGNLNSQSIDVKWSDQFLLDNKQDGFFDDFVGSNSTYIYGKFSNLALLPKKRNQKVKLVAFDKASMKKAGETDLRGFGGSLDKEDYKYYKTVTLDNLIYVFWTKEQKDVVELYVQSFDTKLKKVNNIKKIYELNDSKSKGTDKLIILYNKDVNNKIVIAKEVGLTQDNENLRIEYKLLNPDFSFVTAKQVTLPIKVTKKRRGLFSSYSNSIDNNLCKYEFGNDGNLYIEDMVKASDEEKKLLKKREASVYPHIMQIQMESGNLQDYSLKFTGKNTFNYSSLITKNGIKLYGFFSDLDKDEKGKDTHGTFLVTLDNTSFKAKEPKFSYFDKTFLDQLYAADKENQKKGKGIFKSSKAKASDEQSIDDNYIIEKVIEDGNDILLFCSIMKNWSRTVCSGNANGGGTSCRTYYYCTKSNVTAFRLNGAGDIVWAKNLDRSMTYSGWNIYDLSVMKNGNSYYVTYGSQFEMNAKKKNMRSSKSRAQLNDRLEYAVFSGQTGEYKKAEYQVNRVNAKKADKKYVGANQISVFDNKMYTSYVRTKIKPTTFISCLCPPVFYYLIFSGNSRKGTGYFGTIAPLK
jgi:hypothetical protein